MQLITRASSIYYVFETEYHPQITTPTTVFVMHMDVEV